MYHKETVGGMKEGKGTGRKAKEEKKGEGAQNWRTKRMVPSDRFAECM